MAERRCLPPRGKGVSKVSRLCRRVDATSSCLSSREWPKSVLRQHGRPLAMWSAIGGCMEMATLLLTEQTVEPTELMTAAAGNGHADFVRDLLRRGATPNTLLDTWTPLMSARGHVEVVQVVIGASAAMDMRLERTGRTALHMACSYGHIDAALELIGDGASTLVRDAMDMTPRDLDEGNQFFGMKQVVDRLAAINRLRSVSSFLPA